MKVLVIIGHQRRGSFCHAIAEAAVAELKAAGHDVIYHDLYEEGFDPVLPHDEIPKGAQRSPVVQKHCDELMAAEGYVVIHPNWWAMPPAVLKGWIDRVLCQGVAYEFGAGGAVIAHLKGKSAVVFTTSNTPRDAEMKLFGDPLENLWKNCIFGFCGVEDFHRRNFESIILSTPDQRRQWLAEVRQAIKERFPPQDLAS
ncbi:MAG: NAD(P)H dehydrogenase [Planctomycetes bacterium RBG_16_64_12]|nr:MAG: NAD(P)H dehydrogenase [Planctomycetes bacterium RBG_16_64_12]